MADSLNVLSLYTNQRRHIVQCNDMQERAITNGLICYQSTDKHFPIHATISDRQISDQRSLDIARMCAYNRSAIGDRQMSLEFAQTVHYNKTFTNTCNDQRSLNQRSVIARSAIARYHQCYVFQWMQSKYFSSICFQQCFLLDAGSTSELISSSLKLTSSISQFNCITNALSRQAQSASSSAPKNSSKLAQSANSIASLMASILTQGPK